jgi:hypothetical protein
MRFLDEKDFIRLILNDRLAANAFIHERVLEE